MGDTGNDNMSKLVKFPAESIILKEGEVNLDMYKIVQGNAELYTGYGTDKEVLLGIIGPQACFGEFGLLMQAPSIYTVVAFSDIYAMRITAGEMGDFVQENHKNVIDIMKNMARTMMVMQKQIDLMTGELLKGNKPDEDLIKQSQRNLRGYAVYNPHDTHYNLTGKYRFIDVTR